MQPPVANRIGGRIGLFPVARHHDVAAHDDLADLAGRKSGPVAVDDSDLDVGPGHADALDTFAPAWVIAVGVIGLRQRGDRHRRLALAVDLGEARSEDLERVGEIGQVHRCPAVDDRLQAGEVGVRGWPGRWRVA